MTQQPTPKPPGKKLPFMDWVKIPTLNIGNSVTISSSTPLNWDTDPTWFAFSTKEYGDVPLAVGFLPKELVWDNDDRRRGRLSINARFVNGDWLPCDQRAWLKDLFIEGEHAWFTVKNVNDHEKEGENGYYVLTFPTGKTISFIKPDGLTAPVNVLDYEWHGYPTGASAFSDAVIQ